VTLAKWRCCPEEHFRSGFGSGGSTVAGGGELTFEPSDGEERKRKERDTDRERETHTQTGD
jgi:hypothetical protein